SEKIVQRNGQILLRRGFDFRYPSYTQQFIPMVEQLGGKLVSDDGKTGVIGDEAWLQFFEYMREWGPHGKDLGGPTYTAARSVFDLDNNEIAMSESGLYQQSRMNSVNPDFYNSDDWMVIPYPQWSNATQVSNGKIAAHYYVVNGQSAEAKQIWAWKLISFMLSHSEDYLEQVNLVQPTYELFESEAFKNIPYSDVFAKDLENATLTYFGSGSTAMNDKLKSAVEDVMLQGKDPKTVLESFRKDIQEIIDDI
ncbi:MAG: extracellular solute-binding protein, partial [Spirochaetales bacterium]